jgi:hypothetical protein
VIAVLLKEYCTTRIMSENPLKESINQEKKEFSTLLTLSIIYAIGTVVVVGAAIIVTSNIVN